MLLLLESHSLVFSSQELTDLIIFIESETEKESKKTDEKVADDAHGIWRLRRQ